MTSASLDTATIARKAKFGLRWSLLGMIATKVGSFAMGVVLARLLNPDDFGIYAIALAALAFLMCVKDIGLTTAVVNWRGDTERMLPTATLLAALFSVAIYVILWVAAPPFATVGGSPQAAPVLRLLAVVIVIDGLASVRSAVLMRSFKQDKLTLANMAGFVVNAALAIALAVAGAGAFSFAGGQVAGAFVTGMVVLIYAKMPFRLGFDRAVARQLMRFGIPLAASLGVEALLINSSFVIVGSVVHATALGFFLLAFNISSWVQGTFGTAIRYVSVAGFSRLAEHKEGVLSSGVQKSVPLLVTGLVPIAVLLATLAGPLIVALYGQEWAPAAPVLQFLAALTVVRMLTSLAMDILMGAGATRWTLWLNVGWAAFLVPALFVGTHLGGIIGAAVAHAIVGVLVALPLAMWALHRAGVTLAPIGPALVRPALGGILAGGISLLVVRVAGPHAIIQLMVAGGAATLAYAVVAVSPEQLRRWVAQIRRENARERADALTS